MLEFIKKNFKDLPFNKISTYFNLLLPLFFVLIYVLIIGDSFPSIRNYTNIHFISIVFLLMSMLFLAFLIIRETAEQKRTQFYLYCSFFLLTEIVVQSTGGISSVLYPLMYLLILVYLALSPMRVALFFLLLTIITESVIISRLPGEKLNANLFAFDTHVIFFIVFFVVFYFTLLYEKKQKNKYRLLLKTYEGLGDSSDVETEESENVDVDVLSEQGKKRHSITVTHKLNEKIYDVLGKLKEVIHPLTIMYLEIDPDENKFFIKEVISESDKINYNLDISTTSGHLGWVVKNRRTLNVNNFDSSIHDLFYYSVDVVVKSIIMVPMIDNDVVKGVLLADSHELQYFSHKEENLMYLVSYQIMQETNNFMILRKMEYNAKEAMVLNNLGKKLNDTLNLKDTIQVIITAISNLVKCDLITVVFEAKDDKECRIITVQGDKYKHLIGKEFEKKDSICGYVIDSKQKVLFSDFTIVSASKTIFSRSIRLKEMFTIYMLPLITNDVSFGAVLIASKTPLNLTEHTADTIETLINQSATAISNSRLYMKMELMATTDGLTGLFNHRCFQERITEEIDRIQRYPEDLSVLLMDIDHFKKFNDTYGHPIGDKVLKKVAKIFEGSLRKVDFAARYGGEEFVAILINTGKGGAIKMGERIRKNIAREHVNVGDNTVEVNVSIGIATFPRDSKDKKGLINLADKALYYAKETGRNKTMHYQDIVEGDVG